MSEMPGHNFGDVTATAAPEAPTAPVDVDSLCRDNIALVHYEVRALATRLPAHVATDDLTSAGMAALAAAALSYDPDRGVPFARYAARRIKGALLDELRAMDWASRSVRTRARERDAAHDTLAARLRREPTPTEVADHLGVEADQLARLTRDVHQSTVLRLDALVEDGALDALAPATTTTPETALLAAERETYLAAAVAALPDRLRTVITATFYHDRPLREVADDLGVTESRISQMRTEALTLLRDGINTHLDPALAPTLPTGVTGRRRATYYADIATRATHTTRRPTPTTPAAAHTGPLHTATA